MKMTKKIYLISGVFLVVLVMLVIFSYTKPHPVLYHLQILQFDHGWGYCIKKNGKPFIYQQYIPALEGNIIFPDRESAYKTGHLVLKKLRKNTLPAISKSDLIKIGVVEEEIKKQKK